MASPALAEEFVVSQKNKVFLYKGKSIERIQIKVGDSIKFVNDDPLYHNVFSSSDASRFDLGMFPQGEARTMLFKQRGEIEVECSIHPYMYLKVDVQ